MPNGLLDVPDRFMWENRGAGVTLADLSGDGGSAGINRLLALYHLSPPPCAEGTPRKMGGSNPALTSVEIRPSERSLHGEVMKGILRMRPTI